MKRSLSPDSLSSAKSPKLFHHSPDDGGAEGNSYRLPYTLSDENLSCLPISQAREPPAIYLDPALVKGTFFFLFCDFSVRRLISCFDIIQIS